MGLFGKLQRLVSGGEVEKVEEESGRSVITSEEGHRCSKNNERQVDFPANYFGGLEF